MKMGDYSSDNHTFTFSSYHYTPYTYQDTDLHEYEWDNVDKERQRLFAAGFFVLLFLGILGLLGNAFQLHAIVSFPAMRRKPENVYLANIAVAGLFYMTTVGLCVIIVCGCEAFKELYYTYYSYHQFLRLNFVIDIGTLVRNLFKAVDRETSSLSLSYFTSIIIDYHFENNDLMTTMMKMMVIIIITVIDYHKD